MERILKGDFHTHMNGSGVINRWNNLKKICQKSFELGFNSVFLGCHDYVGASFKDLVIDRYGLIPIPGAEITTNGGHILALNIEYIPDHCTADADKPADVFEVIEAIHQMKGRAILAHPHKDEIYRVPIEKFAEQLDGAEVENLKHYMSHGVWNFEWIIKKYPNLKPFRVSDADIWNPYFFMHKNYYTEVEESWLRQ